MGVIQGGQNLSLPPEPRQAFHVGRERRGQHLDRHVAAQPRIFCAVDLPHPARAQWGEDLVGTELRACRKRHNPGHWSRKFRSAGRATTACDASPRREPLERLTNANGLREASASPDRKTISFGTTTRPRIPHSPIHPVWGSGKRARDGQWAGSAPRVTRVEGGCTRMWISVPPILKSTSSMSW